MTLCKFRPNGTPIPKLAEHSFRFERYVYSGLNGTASLALICRLYGDKYDDREEDSKIRGLAWEPGVKASHKSMAAFQKELEEVHGIHLSRTKLQKILITGHCWTTERSREVQWLFNEYTASIKDGGKGMNPDQAIIAIAKHLEISTVSVIINLPYREMGERAYHREESSGYQKKELKPGAKPEASFAVTEPVVAAYEYCNLHGLWMAKA